MDYQKGRIEMEKLQPIVDPHRGELTVLASRITKLEKQMTEVLSRLAASNYLGSHVRNEPMPPSNEELD